jgi:hypothetical protein
MRRIIVIVVLLVGATMAEIAAAQSRSPRSTLSLYSVDPFDVAVPGGSYTEFDVVTLPQLDPFGWDYNLLGGFRPIYSGVRQPIGHETIVTHNGNGGIYRPIYAPSPGYHLTPQGALIVERPGRYPVPTYVVPAAPAPRPAAASGPREF